MSREQVIEKKNFYYTNGGMFKQKVDQEHPEAQRRDWETPDGKSGTKYERHITALFGFITNIQFFDGDYGRSIQITLDPDEDGIAPVISLNASSREGTDFLRKILNVNLKKEVKLAPYEMENDGESRRGLTVYQQDEADNFTVKIGDFYRDFEKKENMNGMPNPPKPNDEMTKNAWKAYFLQVDDFLVENTQKIILPQFKFGEVVDLSEETGTSDPFFPEVSAAKNRPSVVKEEGEVDDSEIPF